MGNSPSNSKKSSPPEGFNQALQNNPGQNPQGAPQNPQYGQGAQPNIPPNANQSYSRNTQNPQQYPGNQPVVGNNPSNYQGVAPNSQNFQPGSQTQGNAPQNIQRPPQNYPPYQGGNQTTGNPPQNFQNQQPPYSQSGFQSQSTSQNSQYQSERRPTNYGNPNQPPSVPPNQPPQEYYGRMNSQSNPQTQMGPPSQSSYPPTYPQNNQPPNYSHHTQQPNPNFPQNTYNKDPSEYLQYPPRNINAPHYPQNPEFQNNPRVDNLNQIPPYYSEQEYKAPRPYYPNQQYYKDQNDQYFPPESYRARGESLPYSNPSSEPFNYQSRIPISSEYYSVPTEHNQFQGNYEDYNVYSPPSAYPSGGNSSPYRSHTPIPSGRTRSPPKYVSETNDKYGYPSPYIGENARLVSSRIISNPLNEGNYSYDQYYEKDFNRDIISSKNLNLNQSYDFSNANLPKSKLISRQILDPNSLPSMPQYFPSKTYSPKKLGYDYNYNNKQYEMPISQRIEGPFPSAQRKVENVIEPPNYDDQLIASNRIPRATLANQEFTSQNQFKRETQTEYSNSLKPSGGSKMLKK